MEEKVTTIAHTVCFQNGYGVWNNVKYIDAGGKNFYFDGTPDGWNNQTTISAITNGSLVQQDISYQFDGDTNLQVIDIGGRVETAPYALQNCPNLSFVSMGFHSTTAGRKCPNMFRNSSINEEAVFTFTDDSTIADEFFAGSALRYPYDEESPASTYLTLRLGGVTSAKGILSGLTSLYGRATIEGDNVRDLTGALAQSHVERVAVICPEVTTIDHIVSPQSHNVSYLLSAYIDAPNLESARNAFKGCYKLNTVQMTSLRNVKDATDMFSGCTRLSDLTIWELPESSAVTLCLSASPIAYSCVRYIADSTPTGNCTLWFSDETNALSSTTSLIQQYDKLVAKGYQIYGYRMNGISFFYMTPSMNVSGIDQGVWYGTYIQNTYITLVSNLFDWNYMDYPKLYIQKWNQTYLDDDTVSEKYRNKIVVKPNASKFSNYPTGVYQVEVHNLASNVDENGNHYDMLWNESGKDTVIPYGGYAVINIENGKIATLDHVVLP